MSDESDVLAANEAFYQAFEQESATRMDALWARRAPVACVHPGWPPTVGRPRVMATWKAIFESGAPAIRCAGAEAHTLGDTAFVLCRELLADGQLAATNVFVREDGAWKMVHHHASPIAAAADMAGSARSDDVGPN